MLTLYDLQERLQEENSGHWLVNEDVDLNDCSELIELLQTGSVTIQVGSQKFVVEIRAEEAK